MFATTSHDRPIVINGYFCNPGEAVELKAIERNSSLDPNNVELSGSQSLINQNTILTHRLAYKDIYTLKGINWRNPPSNMDDHPIQWRQYGTSGETSIRGTIGWTIQEQSMSERRLAQTPNKLTSPVCRHSFCDSGCQLNLADHTFDPLIITEVFSQVSFRVNYAPPDYSYGYVVFIGEPNANASFPITSGTGGIIVLGDMPEWKLEVGHTLRAYRGCSKTIGYCRSVYNNSINFGGIPPEGDWIPGNNKYQAPAVQR
jgi:uncharacterized phage protein (TIGR02218 family)